MLSKSLMIVAILALGLLVPERGMIPVQNASSKDWNPHSFWYDPWGKSGVHKGIDIFAKQNTPVVSSTSGLVLFTGDIEMGGNVAVVIGPKWRIHYYAHLNTLNTHLFEWRGRGDLIGTVGNSGNAVGKPPHLHYSVFTIVPCPWHFSTQKQGWKKVFYINPVEVINNEDA